MAYPSNKQSSFTTPKGTELPLLDMRGKPYLQVAHRLVWFREERADWSIETDFVAVAEKSAFAKATIRDALGRVVATAHKYEDQQGFGDFREKAETGAVGRALAMCGYGTQFCSDELDEGERLADSPISRPAPAHKPQSQAAGPEAPADPRSVNAMLVSFQGIGIAPSQINAKYPGQMLNKHMDELRTIFEKIKAGAKPTEFFKSQATAEVQETLKNAKKSSRPPEPKKVEMKEIAPQVQGTANEDFDFDAGLGRTRL